MKVQFIEWYNASVTDQQQIMTVKSRKYIIQQAPADQSFIRKHWLAIVLVLLIPISFALGVLSNENLFSGFLGSQASIQSTNKQLSVSNNELIAKNSLLDTEVKIKQMALLEMQDSYDNLLQENNQLQTEVDFFQNLLASNSGAKGLRVYNLSLDKDSNNQHLVTVVLAQKLQIAQVVKGAVKLTLKGYLKTVEGEQKKDQLQLNDNFEFKYYQIIRQSFLLEEDFYPTELLVELTTDENKPKTLSQSYQWQELMNSRSNN